MSVSLPASRRLLRATAVPVLVGALPALAFTTAAGLGLSGAAAGGRPVTQTSTHTGTRTGSTPTRSATASVRRQEVVAPLAGTRTAVATTTSTSATAITTSAEDTVNSAYWSMFASGLNVPTGWTGSISGCHRGSVSTNSRSATLRAVNFVRRLGGLAPVRFDSTMNAHAQSTALIMAANQQLSHYPTSSWRCWTRTGATTAARSNLALAYPDITSAGLVEMYMDDIGNGNEAVGHRRWVMNPFATSMGSGSTGTANALQVVGPTSSRRPNPAYVGWPTKGWFPDTLEPHGRWSLSAGDARADFRYAQVHVYQGTRQLTVKKYRVESGYARPTIVWQMPTGFTPSGSYTVKVTGIRHRGSGKRFSSRYVVRFFTPYH